MTKSSIEIIWDLGALDWDWVKTKPRKKKLMDLGLDDVAQELWPPEKLADPGQYNMA